MADQRLEELLTQLQVVLYRAQTLSYYAATEAAEAVTDPTRLSCLTELLERELTEAVTLAEKAA